MIVVRDIFQVKFGRIREAIDLLKEESSAAIDSEYGKRGRRLLADFAGMPYYTLIMESSFESMSEFEQAAQRDMAKKEWRDWYQKFIPLVESGRREILREVS